MAEGRGLTSNLLHLNQLILFSLTRVREHQPMLPQRRVGQERIINPNTATVPRRLDARQFLELCLVCFLQLVRLARDIGFFGIGL